MKTLLQRLQCWRFGHIEVCAINTTVQGATVTEHHRHMCLRCTKTDLDETNTFPLGYTPAPFDMGLTPEDQSAFLN